MNQPTSKNGNPYSQLDAPPHPELRWIRCCLILFLFSFAASFRHSGIAPETENAGSSLLPVILLAVSLSSGGIALLIGLRHLFVRPGAYLVLLGFGFLAFTAVNGFIRHDETAETVRSLITPLLLWLGITTTHIAACAGMRASEAIRYFLIAAGCSLFFQFGLEFLANQLQLREMNFEFVILLGLLIAWAVCVLLLRRTITLLTLSLAGLLIAAAALAIAGNIAIPILIPAAGASVCLILGMVWRLFPRDQFWKRFSPLGLLMLLGAIQLASEGSSAHSFFGSTKAEYSSETVGILMMAGIFLITLGMSLRAAWRNSETVMGRWSSDAYLMFLPFVALPGLLGESLIHNPYGQPFTAVLAGMLVAMPQFFFNRAFYLRHRENEAAIAPQLILNEEDLPGTWDGAFPTNA